MTQNQAVAWILAQIGKHLDYDKLYGQQCFDFFNYYYQFVTGDGPYADGYAVPGAKDIWGIPNGRFTYLPDSPSLMPQPGDIAVYGASWGAGYGHVEVVVQTTNSGCYFVGENEHGSNTEGAVKVFRTWPQMRGLIGVMRYHWNNNNQGVEEVIPDQDNYYWRYGQKTAQAIRGRQLSRAEFSKYIAGQNPTRALEILEDDPEADKAATALVTGQTALADNWQGKIADLTNQLADLTSQVKGLSSQVDALTKAVEIKDKTIADLTAKLAAQGDDTAQLNTLGSVLQWFIKRLGLK